VNTGYRPRNWSGTISFWLNLSPDTDLEPGYTDPLQITDKAYNNAAIWVDFTRDDKPRHFRLGVFGDSAVWNAKNLPTEENAFFNQRTVVVTKPPFAHGQWTHVAIVFSDLNTDAGGTAKLYLNGQLTGTAEGIKEPFTWESARATIRLGVNYVGLCDELSIYDRALKGAAGEPEMHEQLERWRKEAALHSGFEHGGTGRFAIMFEGRRNARLPTTSAASSRRPTGTSGNG
jgi:hypothetical protein